jgi:hypothetical protein
MRGKHEMIALAGVGIVTALAIWAFGGNEGGSGTSRFGYSVERDILGRELTNNDVLVAIVVAVAAVLFARHVFHQK